ncbi:MAG: L-serine ammonia-lyase [Desulfovibrionaceae bacterium]|nr:L-serine ammonia-lyase [Desulfovibrionaceae bacterium]
MNPIDTSIFELFKIGPGPSSSHTIGPMVAGGEFIKTVQDLGPELLARASRVQVRLFGSLSATGEGHGTDRAVMAGLLGQTPETCPPEFLDGLADKDAAHNLSLPGREIALRAQDVIFDSVEHDFPFNNTLVIGLLDPDGKALFERQYYSIGGGFIHWEGRIPPKRGAPAHPYATMRGLEKIIIERGLSLNQVMLDNETAISGLPRPKIVSGLRRMIRVMDQAVARGLKADGVLPGPLGLARKAKAMFAHYRSCPQSRGRLMLALDACAFAVAEENASGHTVVTAPTCGSAGVIPACLYVMRRIMDLPEENLVNGMLAAAAVGLIVKRNASVAGAEVGCQGEIGVAAAMAAAMLAQAAGKPLKIVENAAETALEHHLGMTCDPVAGYVQIPCIERNAMGAVKAYNAMLIACSEAGNQHLVGLDQVIRAMAATGRDMSDKYKETALGGLGVSMVNC